MSHLLPLSNLHAAAPGVLDIVFGPDGDFEGAPYWVGPVSDIDPSGVGGIYHVAAVLSGGSVATIEGAGNLPLYSVALDLRIPSVAARLIWLCGLALGYNGPLYCYESHDEDCNGVKHDDCCWYLLASRAHEGGAYYWQKNFSTEAAFIASMTLALAPKIAALGGSRV